MSSDLTDAHLEYWIAEFEERMDSSDKVRATKEFWEAWESLIDEVRRSRAAQKTTEEFAWLIEAPGQNYLGTREVGYYPEFFWTDDHTKAIRFFSKEQADGVMMAVRRMEPKLWAFAVNLTDARPTEHGWISAPSAPEGGGS